MATGQELVWAALERKRNFYTARLSSQVVDLLSKVATVAVDSYQASRSVDLVALRVSKTISTSFSEALFRLTYLVVTDDAGKVWEPLNDIALHRWASAHLAVHVKGLSKTTVAFVTTEVEKAVHERLSSSALENVLRSHYMFSTTRAVKTTRMMATAALNAANYFKTSSALGDSVFKIWFSCADTEGRDAHAALNGTHLQMSQLFAIEGSELRFPGDASMGASIKELINCRCALLYKRK